MRVCVSVCRACNPVSLCVSLCLCSMCLCAFDCMSLGLSEFVSLSVYLRKCMSVCVSVYVCAHLYV